MAQCSTLFRGPFVITGLSGGGKSVLSRSLEDLGYNCVDNIPLELVEELFLRSQDRNRLVVVLDVRTAGMAETFPEIHARLNQQYDSLRLIFVEAADSVLEQRFSVARRPHPLRDMVLERAISEERSGFEPIRRLADLVVDTTSLSPHDLRRHILELAGVESPSELMKIEIQSFSYLQGVPSTASLVFDVRFLPNPYFEEELRPLSGSDDPVGRWLSGHDEVLEAIERIGDLVGYLVPAYARELKTHLLVGVGCTGGRHRSVFVAEQIAGRLKGQKQSVEVHHRDRDNWRY
ncbi:MAG: RNase adapter RapZ [Acidobacteria bacterium]|nr:MAG: RNase adapter RapZ [Acidobacteriota bacterium]